MKNKHLVALAASMAVAVLSACGGGQDVDELAELQAFINANPTATTRSYSAMEPLEFSGTGGTELLANGTFAQGGSGWREISASGRSASGDGPIIGTRRADIPAPPSGQSVIARLCGVKSGGTSCAEVLTTLNPFTVPAGTKNITVTVTAYARYACSNPGPFYVTLQPTDGKAPALPPSAQLTAAELPAGTWREFTIMPTVPADLATSPRQFRLTLNFRNISTAASSCAAPGDVDTFVAVSRVSVRAQ